MPKHEAPHTGWAQIVMDQARILMAWLQSKQVGQAMKSWAANEPLRARAYGLVAAVSSLLVMYEVITPEQESAWLNAAAVAIALVASIESARAKVTPVAKVEQPPAEPDTPGPE